MYVLKLEQIVLLLTCNYCDVLPGIERSLESTEWMTFVTETGKWITWKDVILERCFTKHRPHASRRNHPLQQRRNGSVCWCVMLYLQRVRSIPSLPGVMEVQSAFLFLVTLTFDLWPWHSNSSERGTKHVFHVNFAQIRSAVPEILEW